MKFSTLIVLQGTVSSLTKTKPEALTYDGPEDWDTSMKTSLLGWAVQPLPFGVDFATVNVCKDSADYYA